MEPGEVISNDTEVMDSEINEDIVQNEVGSGTTVMEFDDSRIVEALTTANDNLLVINESLVWLNAFSVVIICLLVFSVFFIALGAGKK